MDAWIPRARGELHRTELAALLGARPDEPARLEAALREATGWPEAVAAPSARVGIVAAIEALGVPDGAEVLLGALGYPPLVERLRARWRVRVVDVDARGSACPRALAAAVGPRTGAILATHPFGRPAPMRAYRRIADALGIPLVEDAAQALGARPTARGDAAVFSFGPTKPLSAWGGGAVVCRSPRVAEALRARLPRGGGSALRVARGVAFELASRAAGPIARRPEADAPIERWLVDPPGALRRRPWQDAPMGPIEACLVRLRLADLEARTRARRARHAALVEALRARAVPAWRDAPGGIGFGVLVPSAEAEACARALRHRGVDAPFAELPLVGDRDQHPRAAELARTLLRLPVAW